MQIILVVGYCFAYNMLKYMQMKKFDYTFLKRMMIPADFLNLTKVIYAIKNEEGSKKNQYPEIFTGLQKIAKVQSVKGSNAIEGIVTTDKRIEEIVNKSSAPLNHNEKEIAGYRDALNLIHNNYPHLPLNEETILNLHRIMLNETELTYKGVYKQEDNEITARYLDGTIKTLWTPTPAKDTKQAMEQLVLAYTEARDDAGINQLLLIPCVILDFLCIHPFQDGNGRMSRLLSLMLLYKNDYDIPQYVSFEEQINKNKESYYLALEKASSGWHENQNDYIPFMDNFLATLFACYEELNKRFLTLHSKKTTKAKRIEEVVLSAFTPISKREICDLLIDVSVTTVEAVLSTLLEEGKIVKLGETRNAKYFKK